MKTFVVMSRSDFARSPIGGGRTTIAVTIETFDRAGLVKRCNELGFPKEGDGKFKLSTIAAAFYERGDVLLASPNTVSTS